MFKNMKIPVKNNLDEIVAELEKRGYVCEDNLHCSTVKYIFAFNDRGFIGSFMNHNNECALTTLAELKEM